MRLLASFTSLGLVACDDSGTEHDACGTIQAHWLVWDVASVEIAANSRGSAPFVLEPIGPAPVCAVRTQEVFVCGRPGKNVVPPPGQPTAVCVRVPDTCGGASFCGPYSMEIETTMPGTYELWLAASDTAAAWGRPQGHPLDIVVR